MPISGTKNVLFGYSWTRILKNYVIFEINTLEFVKIEVLTHTVNFCIGSLFSKGSVSAFSEGPGPAPGPGPDSLCKVCRFCSLKEKNCYKRFIVLQNIRIVVTYILLKRVCLAQS